MYIIESYLWNTVGDNLEHALEGKVEKYGGDFRVISIWEARSQSIHVVDLKAEG